MARSYRMTVQYDPTNGLLKIDRSDLTLAPDTPAIHSVCWMFEGVSGLVAAGWAPAIRFSQGPNESQSRYTGPFTNLNMTTSAVIASGLNGKSGTYYYYAVLKAPIGSGLPPIESGRARLFNQVTDLRPAVVNVFPDPNREGILRVQPEALSYAAGQSILWKVSDDLEDQGKWFPRLSFDDGPGSINSRFGPFTSLDTTNTTIRGSGSAGHPPGLHKYLFQMVRLEDNEVQFRSSPDPTIADEGDPPAEIDP